MEEGNADDTDDNKNDDYDEIENLVDDVLGNDEDDNDDNDDDNYDYDAVADDDINSKDDGSGEQDSNDGEEEFFPVFKEEEGTTVTTTD